MNTPITADPIKPASNPALFARSDSKKVLPRVVVAEDERDARDLLVAALRRRGLECHAAADGAEALARVDTGAIDTVVSDIVMPRMSGLELLKTLRSRGWKGTFIIITSFADKDHVMAALNLGSDYLLEKPFTAEQVFELVLRYAKSNDVQPTPDASNLSPTQQVEQEDAYINSVFRRRIANLDLTPHERQLLVYVLKGLPNRSIAEQFQTKEQTVKNQLLLVYRKLGVSSRGELFHLLFPV